MLGLARTLQPLHAALAHPAELCTIYARSWQPEGTAMSDFDSVFEEVGGFGRVQRRIFILISLMEAPAAWAMYLPVLIHATPEEWTCADAPSNITEMWTSGNKSSTSVNTSAMCSISGDACEGLQFNSSYTSIVTEWQLVCSWGSTLPSLLLMLQMLGVFVGACVFGQLADMYGRRGVMFTAYFLMIVSMGVSALVPYWQLYALCRTLLGAFIGGTLVINQVMPLEFVSKRWRTFCGCVGLWAIGVVILGGLAYWIRDWRHLTLTTALLSTVLLPTWWFIPESPRWLIQKGRIAEAEKILTMIATGNHRTAPDFSKLRLMAQSAQERKAEGTKYSFWDLCRNFSLTRNTTIMVYTWFVCSFVYYGVSMNAEALSGNRYLNISLLGVADLPALAFVIILNNTLGRRRCLFILMSVAGSSCFAMLFLDLAGKLEELSMLTQILVLLGKSGVAGSWAAAQVFSAELFPTVVRNIGVGACSMAARVGGVLAPQVILLNQFSAPLPYVIFGSLGLLCAGLTFLLPETLNQPLPDTLPPREYCTGCFKRSEDKSCPPSPTATVSPLQETVPLTQTSADRQTKTLPLTEDGAKTVPLNASDPRSQKSYPENLNTEENRLLNVTVDNTMEGVHNGKSSVTVL